MDKNEIVNEEKSISSTVKEESLKLYNVVVEDFFNVFNKGRKYQSKANNQVFATNTIKYGIEKIAPEIGVIDVEYYVYICDTHEEYRNLFNLNLNLNCGFDYDDKKMILVGFYVENKLYRDLKSSIFHEMAHLYQYSKGMEKRVSLYNKCLEFVESENPSKYVVGFLTYYTFPHEQDAMAHQFYSELMDKKPTEHFDECILKYSEYRNVAQPINYLKRHWKETFPFVKELGFEPAKWKKRLHFSLKRMVKKFSNAYTKYRMDYKYPGENILNEMNAFFNRYIDNEKKYPSIKIGLESFYSKYNLNL